MDKMICPKCSTSSPKHALFCQSCSQPLVCRSCRALLLPTAHACIQCGLLIPERSNETFQVTPTTSGYSRFKIHETPDIREIDFIFANEAIEYVRDLFPLLLGTHLLGRDKNGRHHLTGQADMRTAVSEASSPDTDHHSNGGHFSDRDTQARIRAAHVRLVPFNAGGYPVEATDVVDTLADVSPSQTPSPVAVETFEDVLPPQIPSLAAVGTLADVLPSQAQSAAAVETRSPVSSPPQPHEVTGPAPTGSKFQTSSLKWQIAITVAIGMALSVLDNTIISVTLPQMQKAFQTDFDTITWVATVYFLAQAAVIPVVGYLSDRISSKLVFLGALTLFIVGSALCALAPTKEALITFRGIQGIGGGALIPLGMAIVYRTFPPSERGKGTAVVGLPILMAPAFGPTLGGYLSTTFDWYAIFIINIPIGILALLLALRFLPGRTFEQATQANVSRYRLDILGLLLSMASFAVLVYGISEAAPKGWGDKTVVTSLVVGAVLLIALVVVELRVREPVLDIRLFTNYTFSIASLLSMISVAVFYGSLFLLPFFFENVQGDTALTAGEFLIIQGLGTAVGVIVSGILYNRVGPRILTALGMLCLAGGSYMLTQIDINTTGQALQATLILRGIGAGFLTMPLQTLGLSVVSNKAMAKASSLLNILRQTAIALGVTGLTTYLVQQTTTHATDTTNAILDGLKTQHFTGVAATCVQAGGLTHNLDAIKNCVIQHATVTGLTDTFWIVLILPAASVLLALVIGRDPAVEAHKKAKARGEKVDLHHQPALSE